MAGSIDYVLQSDGTYKWEVTELKPKTRETTTEVTPEPKATKKKVTKKKTTNPLSE
jgi:hypothetical protein